MTELHSLYARLLSLGFIVLGEAASSGDSDWLKAELEMLHNLPSLLDEDDVERHRTYWFSERQHYIDWASVPGREQAKSRMLTYYEPAWREMEPLITELLQSHARSQQTHV